MSRHPTLCLFALMAVLGATAPSEPLAECPKSGSEVVVKALRFSEGPPAYSFMVTNNGARPLVALKLGRGEDTFAEVAFESIPASMGSPTGWQGTHVLGQDPRHPEAHSTSLISYLWTAEDSAAWIRQGQSLSGFSVQFPPPKESPDGRPRPAHPDLAATPFTARPYGARCPTVGMVRFDQSMQLPPANSLHE